MPFFSGRPREPEPTREPSPPPPPVDDPPRRRGTGLFNRRRSPSPPPVDNTPPPAVASDPPRRSGTGLFHRHRSPSPSTRTAATHASAGSNSSLSSAGSNGYDHRDGSRRSSGMPRRSLLSKRLGRGGGRDDDKDNLDPSILAARERVMSAETAEQDADRALDAARQSVAAAREEMRRLEAEAQEDARRAKIKAFHAKEVSKRGKALGRFG